MQPVTAKLRIDDPRYNPGTFSLLLGFTLVVLYFWSTSMHPFWDRPISVAFYFAGLIALVASALIICYVGFKRRFVEIDSAGVTIYEGWYGLKWRKRSIARQQIRSIEIYPFARNGPFAAHAAHGLRLFMTDGSDAILTVSDNAGQMHDAAAEIHQALNLSATSD